MTLFVTMLVAVSPSLGRAPVCAVGDPVPSYMTMIPSATAPSVCHSLRPPFLAHVITPILFLSRHTLAMDISWPLKKLLYSLSEESYDSTFSAYRFWIELGATRHGGVSNHQLYNDILSGTSIRPDLITLQWERKLLPFSNTRERGN